MTTQKQGKGHKKYGAKMAAPRFTRSKEHRSRGPLGYRIRDIDAHMHKHAGWPVLQTRAQMIDALPIKP